MRPRLLRTTGWVCGTVLLTAGSAAAAGSGDVVHSAFGWVFRILNFLLVFGAAVYVGRRYGRRFFAARSARIASAIAEAAQLRQQAEAELAAIERRLAGLEAEVTALRMRARQETAAEAERIRALAAEEVQKIQRAVQDEIAAAERAAQMELKALAARLAVERAETLIRKQMNPELQAKLFRSFVGSLARGAN